MTTREQIVGLADELIREKGYNAFSFYDISRSIGIKTASVHYHFPAKSDLGIAVIEQHSVILQKLVEKYKDKPAREQLDKFFSIYTRMSGENKVCLVGSLATDLNTLDEPIKDKLRIFTGMMISWVTDFLEQGREECTFHFEGKARTKALMLLTNMMAVVQLSRITGDKDLKLVIQTIKNDLK